MITINDLQLIWVSMCMTLVFFMQAGFALLESGSARAKNSVNVLMKNYMDMCLGGIIFWCFGFGLMFGTNISGWLGSDHFSPLQFSNAEAVKLAYQIMFAATSATIVSGAVAERMHFLAYLVFSAIVTGIIYPVYGSWAWNDTGWLKTLGFIDFAGSSVVHSIGAWCSLAGIIALGPRLGRYAKNGETRDIPGHNLSLVSLGGFILWIGWFGFNGGSISSLETDNVGLVLINTHLGGCAGALATLLLMYLQKQPVLMTSTINGSLAGLVSITASAAYINPLSAIIIGFIGGMLYLLTVQLLDRLQLDDVVGAFAVHGAGGIWGTLAVAFFHEGGFKLASLIAQLTGIFMAFIWAFPLAWIFFKLLEMTMGIRASTLHEQRGLDYTEHFEIAYPEFQKRLDSDA